MSGRSSALKVSIVSLALVAGVLSPSMSAMAAKKVLIRWYMGNVSGQSTWKELATMYMKEHRNVEIQYVDGDLDKFYTMITAGMMPDIWGPYATPGIRADVNRDWAVDLTPYISRDAKEININDFFPGLMREFRVSGKQYALPYINWQDYFFYNPDMYAQAGLNPPPIDSSDKSWNWERMVLNSQKLSKYDNSGKLRLPGIDFERTLSSPPAYMHMWGAQPYSTTALKSSVPQQIDWDSPQAVTAFTKAHELIHKYKVAAPASEWGGFEAKKVAQQFKAGWVIQYVMPTKNAKWAIANLPWAVTNKGTMWPDGLRLAKVSKNKEEAWKFIKYLCGKKSLTYLATAPKSPFAAVPMARKSVFNDTLGENVAKLTGMKAADVLRVTEQADDVNVVKFQETICIHTDLTDKFLDPMMADLWTNKNSPAQMAQRLQDVTNRRLPELFKRWVRNIKFTGKEPK